MTGWLVLITIFLFLAASAVGCYPGRQHAVKYLTVAAVVTMVVTVATSLVLNENMFSDVLLVPAALWMRAILAIAVCAGLGILLARLFSGKSR